MFSMKSNRWHLAMALCLAVSTMVSGCSAEGSEAKTGKMAEVASAMTTDPGPPMGKSMEPTAKYEGDGSLVRPEGYREWVYIGTPLTPNDMNNGNAAFPEFHNVYVDPESWAEYKRTGKFRDGAIVIKELTTVGSKSASSGKGYFMGEFSGLEAAVKDSKRYPKESNGWAYYSFGHSYPLAEKAKPQPQSACAQCHLTAPEGSMVFSQYYPVLRGRADGVR